ncbi:hypothetical protein PR048_010080 [Dryococelus australis]|uniref:Uncharacterized protein n=1 Tax=Dryococelus australis TaxID=614101 RepID=A0ABQ9I2H1_9NEOP|nr:hypothetical protein PR048_010080 [Dryococelus australis]
MAGTSCHNNWYLGHATFTNQCRIVALATAAANPAVTIICTKTQAGLILANTTHRHSSVQCRRCWHHPRRAARCREIKGKRRRGRRACRPASFKREERFLLKLRMQCRPHRLHDLSEFGGTFCHRTSAEMTIFSICGASGRTSTYSTMTYDLCVSTPTCSGDSVAKMNGCTTSRPSGFVQPDYMTPFFNFATEGRLPAGSPRLRSAAAIRAILTLAYNALTTLYPVFWLCRAVLTLCLWQFKRWSYNCISGMCAITMFGAHYVIRDVTVDLSARKRSVSGTMADYRERALSSNRVGKGRPYRDEIGISSDAEVLACDVIHCHTIRRAGTGISTRIDGGTMYCSLALWLLGDTRGLRVAGWWKGAEEEETLDIQPPTRDAGPACGSRPPALSCPCQNLRGCVPYARNICYYAPLFEAARRAIGSAVAGRLACSPPTKANGVQSQAGPLGFSQVCIVPDIATGRWIFSDISRFPRPCIPAPCLERAEKAVARRRRLAQEASTASQTLRHCCTRPRHTNAQNTSHYRCPTPNSSHRARRSSGDLAFGSTCVRSPAHGHPDFVISMYDTPDNTYEVRLTFTWWRCRIANDSSSPTLASLTVFECGVGVPKGRTGLIMNVEILSIMLSHLNKCRWVQVIRTFSLMKPQSALSGVVRSGLFEGHGRGAGQLSSPRQTQIFLQAAVRRCLSASGTVNQSSYLQIISKNLIPELRDVGILDIVWFQHDGSPAYFARDRERLSGNINVRIVTHCKKGTSHNIRLCTVYKYLPIPPSMSEKVRWHPQDTHTDSGPTAGLVSCVTNLPLWWGLGSILSRGGRQFFERGKCGRYRHCVAEVGVQQGGYGATPECKVGRSAMKLAD